MHSADKKTLFAFIFIAALGALMITLLLLFTGCATRATQPAYPAAQGLYRAQQAKDTTILAEADNIDAIAPSALAHTTAQRAAVAAAPAADIEPLTRALAALTAENAQLRNQSLREQARWLTWAGIGLLSAFGISIFFGASALPRTWPLAALGAGCFGLAQVISSPWFLRGFSLLLIAGTIYLAYWVYDHYRRGKLETSLAKKVTALSKVVAIVDDAYDTAAEETKRILDNSIFSRLSDKMTAEDKAAIHEIRAQDATALS